MGTVVSEWPSVWRDRQCSLLTTAATSTTRALRSYYKWSVPVQLYIITLSSLCHTQVWKLEHGNNSHQVRAAQHQKLSAMKIGAFVTTSVVFTCQSRRVPVCKYLSVCACFRLGHFIFVDQLSMYVSMSFWMPRTVSQWREFGNSNLFLTLSIKWKLFCNRLMLKHQIGQLLRSLA